MADFDAAGIAVYALSYDEKDALEDFRDAHGITYTLLSDPDSDIIRSFGILNTLIDPADHPWFGIPYPGTYIVDAEGAIQNKFFDNNLAVRAGPEQLLRAAQGGSLEAPDPIDESEVEDVQVSVAVDGGSLAPMVQRDLVVRFSVPAGRHVYAEPAPLGSVAVTLELDENERLVQRPMIRPTGEPHTLAGTGESFLVHHGDFELRLPLTTNSMFDRDSAEILVSGVLRWQSCDDEVCDVPSSQRFEFSLPVSESPPVALSGQKGATMEPNAREHFRRMSERRSSTD